MAARYEQEKKDEVVAFVEAHNAKQGRGGQSAAVEKYGLSPITIASWLKKAGAKPVVKRKGAAKKRGAALKEKGVEGSVEVAAKKPTSSSLSTLLKKMMAIQERIESLQGDYENLKRKL